MNKHAIPPATELIEFDFEGTESNVQNYEGCARQAIQSLKDVGKWRPEFSVVFTNKVARANEGQYVNEFVFFISDSKKVKDKIKKDTLVLVPPDGLDHLPRFIFDSVAARFEKPAPKI